MQAIADILRDLERIRFFGSIEIKYEAGRVVLVRKTETIKPPCRDTRGETNEHESIRSASPAR
jgi:hypothetical protein